MPITNIHTVSIANGQSLSDVVTLGRQETLIGVAISGAWTAAPITFLVGYDANIRSYYRDDSEFLMSGIGANLHAGFNPLDFLGVKTLQIRSGT